MCNLLTYSFLAIAVDSVTTKCLKWLLLKLVLKVTDVSLLMQFLTISSAKCATVWPENPTSPSVVGNITVRVESQKLLEMESLAQILSVGRLL